MLWVFGASILLVINKLSKILQSEDLSINTVISYLKSLISFLETYRKTEFETNKIDAEKNCCSNRSRTYIS